MGAIIVGGLCALATLLTVEVIIPFALKHWVVVLLILVALALIWFFTRPLVVAWIREMHRAAHQREAIRKATEAAEAEMKRLARKKKP